MSTFSPFDDDLPSMGIMTCDHGPSSTACSWIQGTGPLEHPSLLEKLLSTTTKIRSFCIGTGASIFCSSSLLDAIEQAQTEVIFVTCYWAHSTTLSHLSEALRRLSARSLARLKQNSGHGNKVRVRILFSSLSLTQKLFHTNSHRGKIWASKHWEGTLGLPGPHELLGLEMEVKSIFIKPFSVMHPKYVLVDRKNVWLMSANVSWESWLEGMTELRGVEAVRQFMDFFERTWCPLSNKSIRGPERMVDSQAEPEQFNHPSTSPGEDSTPPCVPEQSHNAPHLLAHKSFPATDTACTILLPSTYHINPHFRPFPCLRAAAPPRTPLNAFLLHLFSTAKESIYIQTPNLTCPAVLDHLLSALQRRVNVEIVVSRGMMVLEQLVTAGTTTSRCVDRLIRRYEKLCQADQVRSERSGLPTRTSTLLSTFGRSRNAPAGDEESQTSSTPLADVQHRSRRPSRPKFGGLKISHFKTAEAHLSLGESEPVHNHLKLTIVDEDVCVLGSGNMDRASWYTSQELGLAVLDRGFASTVKHCVEEVLRRRTTVRYQSVGSRSEQAEDIG